MTRVRTLALLLAGTALAASACTGDEPPRTAELEPRATPATTPAGGDPVVFSSQGRTCVEFTGPIVIWEEAEVSRPLTLTGFAPVGLEGDLAPGAASVVAVPEGSVPMTGSVRGNVIPAKWADQVGWEDREPVAGAEIGPGRYYVFLEAKIRGRASYDGIQLSWTDADGQEGASIWRAQDTYRRDCGS